MRRQVRGFGRILRADMREMDTVRPEAASTAQGQDRPGAALHNNKNAAYWRGWGIGNSDGTRGVKES